MKCTTFVHDAPSDLPSLFQGYNSRLLLTFILNWTCVIENYINQFTLVLCLFYWCFEYLEIKDSSAHSVARLVAGSILLLCAYAQSASHCHATAPCKQQFQKRNLDDSTVDIAQVSREVWSMDRHWHSQEYSDTYSHILCIVKCCHPCTNMAWTTTQR